MKVETKIARAKAESEDFGRYAEVMLEEIPDMSLPVLRDCYTHKATAGEYRAHLERVRSGERRSRAYGTSATNITAINVFVEADGKQHIAPIDPEMSSMFMGMLGTFQRGQKDGATLIPLHDDVAVHLLNLRRALLKRIDAQRAQAQDGQQQCTDS